MTRPLPLTLVQISLALFVPPWSWCHCFQSQQQPARRFSFLTKPSKRSIAPLYATYTNLTAATRHDEEDIEVFIESEVDAEIAKTVASVRSFNITTATNRGPPSFRREIELLLSLADSDDAILKLHELWRNDKEPFTALALQHDDAAAAASMTMSRRRRPWNFLTMSKEERQLQRQIRQHPRWTEPRIRLAQLYSREKRNILQAFEQCMVVLEVKPWHLELPHILMQLSLQRQDLGMALTWARLRLPKLNGNTSNDTARRRRRQAWVERAVLQALEQLEVAQVELEQSRMRTAGLVSTQDAWP